MATGTSLSFTVTADATQFESVMQATAQRVAAFETQTAGLSRGVGGSSKRMQMAFTELGRGVEDFLVSFSTGGIAGGLRGAQNNLSQMASLLSPASAGWVALGTAVATVAVPALIRWAGSEKDTQKVLEESKKRLDAYNDSLEQRIGLQRDLREIQRLDSMQQAEGEIQKADDNLIDLRTAFNNRRMQQVKLEVERRKIEAELGGNRATRILQGKEGTTAQVLKERLRLADRFDITQRPGGGQEVRAFDVTGRLAKLAAIEADIATFAKSQAETQSSITEEITKKTAAEKQFQTVVSAGAREMRQQLAPTGMQPTIDLQELAARRNRAELQRQVEIDQAESSLEGLRRQLSDQRAPQSGGQVIGGGSLNKQDNRALIERLERLIRLTEQQLDEMKNGGAVSVSSE